MSKKLTAKQERFCREYLIDLNATAAARRAGYSEKTAKEIGCENLTKPNIQRMIQEALSERSRQTQITANYVLQNIKEELERCKADPDHNSNDVYKGCELLGKHLKLFTDKTEITTPGIEQILNSLQSTPLVRDDGLD